uniref:Uncharacterized protein n=1 Tax=Acrobeloides nanus TaxID=290746 RepID=A0A914E8G2_9BILA
MLSFNLSQHIPNANNGEKLKVYNSYQKNSKFGYIKVPKQKQKVLHYPLNTIAASMETWRDIMGIAQINDSSHLSQVIIDELGAKMLQGPQLRNSELWFADEALASYKIDLWFKKSNNSAHFSHYPH